MKKNLSLFLLLLIPYCVIAKINPEDVTIVRDSWGVPHIYAPTDAGASYGLAYAFCEDNFVDMQQFILAIRGKFGEVQGKYGALLDAIAFMVDAESVVEAQWEKEVSPEFKQILEGYAQGMNDFAELHPKEVLRKGVFPLNGKDILTGYVTNLTFFSNVHYDLVRIFEGTIAKQEAADFQRGSNAWAYAPNRTQEDETVLVCNSHQPLEGALTWYECHVESEEGWSFLGGTMAGGVTPFIGTNGKLGWSHTVNFDDFCDVYRLEMHPKEKLKYRFDGEWVDLESRKLKLKVKVGPTRIPVSRTFYRSKYGPTIKTKQGFYALRFPSNMTVKAAEQWYRMNKAQNLQEFKEALEMQGLPSLNIIYGDQEGNVMYLSNGLFPYRNPAYQWDKVLPGDTSATLWEPQFHPLKDLPQVLNPSSGFVFNTNNSAFHCTATADNLDPDKFPAYMGLQPKHTARSLRFLQLMEGKDKLSYQDIKDMKYDSRMKFPLYTRSIENLDLLRNLDPAKYPDIADAIELLNRWDGSTEMDNREASLFALAVKFYINYLRDEGMADYNNKLPERVIADGLYYAKKHLNKHFGKMEVPLGEVQRHVRGDQDFPIYGTPEAITQMWTKPYKKGKFKSYQGETYILFVRYPKDGGKVLLESVAPFGASNREEDPHYTDQMELFVEKRLKPMTMDKAEIMSSAERVYHPGSVSME